VTDRPSQLTAPTPGAAVDVTIAAHARVYPESSVYQAIVEDDHYDPDVYVVEVRATHFSLPLRYAVERTAENETEV
jgi:hypothetical protein